MTQRWYCCAPSPASLYSPSLCCCDHWFWNALTPSSLRSVSKLSAFTHFNFLVLVVLNLVGGFHALGTLMAVGIMLLPATAGRFWTNSISSLIILAVTFAMLSSFIGLLLSFHYSLPSGPAIILVNSIVYGMSLMFGPVGGIVNQVFFHRQVKV